MPPDDEHLSLFNLPGRLGYATLEVEGPPGAQWVLYASDGTAVLPAGAIGIVLINPFHAFQVADGFLAANGRSSWSVPVPQLPALAGLSAFWQAGVIGPAGLHLTGRVTTTVRQL